MEAQKLRNMKLLKFLAIGTSLCATILLLSATRTESSEESQGWKPELVACYRDGKVAAFGNTCAAGFGLCTTNKCPQGTKPKIEE